MLVASKCIKYTFSGDKIIFEAWINKYGVKESDLSGIAGALPKKQCKKILDLIVNSME